MKKIFFGKNKNITGITIKKYRKKNHLSQSQLAAKMQTMDINLDQQIISKIENNSRIITDYELLGFCIILHISMQDLSNACKESFHP